MVVVLANAVVILSYGVVFAISLVIFLCGIDWIDRCVNVQFLTSFIYIFRLDGFRGKGWRNVDVAVNAVVNQHKWS